MCVDAMVNVFPEDWPLVLANLRRLLVLGLTRRDGAWALG